MKETYQPARSVYNTRAAQETTSEPREGEMSLETALKREVYLAQMPATD